MYTTNTIHYTSTTTLPPHLFPLSLAERRKSLLLATICHGRSTISFSRPPLSSSTVYSFFYYLVVHALRFSLMHVGLLAFLSWGSNGRGGFGRLRLWAFLSVKCHVVSRGGVVSFYVGCGCEGDRMWGEMQNVEGAGEGDRIGWGC